MAKKKNFSNDLYSLLYINIAIIVILLSLFNLKSQRQKDVKVLGSSTDTTYWEELVNKHPTYRDAWVELGRMDKVLEIDPNFMP